MQQGQLVRALVTTALVVGLGCSMAFGADERVLTAAEVLESVEANGDYAVTIAAADIDVAHARLQEAGAGLMPKLTLSASSQFYRPSAHKQYTHDNADAYGKLEVVQPLFDFGQTASVRDAAGKDAEAAAQLMTSARNTVQLEGLALYFDLHASELEVRALNEAHTSAYLRWDRAKENFSLGRASPVEVAEALKFAEKSRLVYFSERSQNAAYRLRLEELTGAALPEELIVPPKPPKAKHSAIDRKKFVAAVWDKNPELAALSKQGEAVGLRRDGVAQWPSLEAYANTGYTTRDLRGRDDYAVGGQVVLADFRWWIDGGEKTRLAAEQSRVNAKFEAKKSDLRRRALTLLMSLDDSYQRVIAARAQHDYTSKFLVQRQQLYAQERVADLGTAMVEHTSSEAELVRATGAYLLVQAQLAVLLGEQPGRSLEPDFFAAQNLLDADSGDFVPKAGTGFGQEDENSFKRQEQ